jgi:xanthine dehydrogenase small subunit
MRGSYESIRLLQPKTAAEALDLYGRSPNAAPMAGGTDLMVAFNMGLMNEKTVLDLSGLKEWRRVRSLKERLIVGSLATHARLREHPSVRKLFPLLSEACAAIGSVQIQNRGTLGGNIANASPAGDSFPPLAVYGATVRIEGPCGSRAVPFLDIFAGVKKTNLLPGELIKEIELPVLEKQPDRQIFRKVGTRKAQTISKLVAAGLLWLDKGHTVKELRFALGSAAPTVRRLKAAEAFMKGKKLSREAADAACGLIEKDISPIDDLRSTAEYRLWVAKNLLADFLRP